MRHFIVALILALQLWLPATAQVIATVKDPLNYPLKQWAFILGLALFGGWASWWAKVKAGELVVYNLSALIGELAISAFVGVITFFGCEYLNLAPLLTAAVVAVSGHMGTKALTLIEDIAAKRLQRKFGGDDDAAR